ncbi:MAG TPA: alpha/beta fold hydrolase, partial [Dehalococcoidia bacterium]|nr:alpha/beta fold hydrolase [Dehalococcoidia bacterium]
INLLGGFELLVDGRAIAGVAWPRRKAKQLLKLLALQPGHALHRDEAIEALWPGADARSGANNLNQTLHVLRRELPGAALVAIQDGRLLLTSGIETDVDAFRAEAAAALRGGDVEPCERALALYAGDLLPEDQYDDWTAPIRDELAAMRRALVLLAAQLHADAGDAWRAEHHLRGLIVRDPLDEEACFELMELFQATGEPRRALTYFRALEKQLRDELDVAASPQTIALAKSIRAAVALADRASATPIDVRHVASADGTSIAYTVHPGGDGVPLLYMPQLPWGHLQLEWDSPKWRDFILRLARRRPVIRYNLRGTGLSERDVVDVSLDRLVEDMHAVVDALAVPAFDVFAADIVSQVTVMYAMRHPERVRRLVFYGGVANGVGYANMADGTGLRALMVQDYDLYAEMWARAAAGFDDELGRILIEWGKNTPFPMVDAYWSVVTSSDVTPMLSSITAPALFVNRRHVLDTEWHPLALDMATHMPNATVVMLDGDGMFHLAADTEPLAAAIDEFLCAPDAGA